MKHRDWELVFYDILYKTDLLLLGVGKVQPGTEVVIAIDTSQQLTPSVLSAMKQFLKSSIMSYNMTSSGDVVFHILSYGDSVLPQLTTKDSGSVVEKLESLPLVGGEKNIPNLLKHISGKIFNQRSDKKRLVLLTVYGDVVSNSEMSQALDQLKDKNVKMVTLAIDAPSLASIITPQSDVVSIGDENELPDVVGVVEKKIASLIGEFN